MLDTAPTPSTAGTTADRLAQAQAAHDEAVQRRQEARADAYAARRAADQARAAVQALLDGAAAGGGTIDQRQHEKLHTAAERANRAATAAQAIADGADRNAERAALELYRAEGADLLRQVTDAAAQEVDDACEVDAALAVLRRKIAKFKDSVRKAAEAVQRAKQFDQAMPARLKQSKIAAETHSSLLPAVRLSDRIGTVKVTATLFWVDTFGVTHEIMNDLGPWRRVGWDGLAPAGPMPQGPIMRAVRGRLG